MAEIQRHSSPRMTSTSISSSPSRPSILSRPHWPYTTYTHRSSSSNSLSSSVHSAPSTGGQGWDYRSGGSGPGTPLPSRLVRRPSSHSLSNAVVAVDDSMRHWSFTVRHGSVAFLVLLSDLVGVRMDCQRCPSLARLCRVGRPGQQA